MVAWLDSGARRAIVAIDVSDPSAVQDLASWSAQLPASRHRLVASFRARDLKAGDGGGLAESLRSAMDGLRPVVGCVQVDFEGDYAAAPQVITAAVAMWYICVCMGVRVGCGEFVLLAHTAYQHCCTVVGCNSVQPREASSRSSTN